MEQIIGTLFGGKYLKLYWWKIEADRRGCHAISRVNKRTFVLFSTKLPSPVLFVAFEKIDSQGRSPIHIIVTHSSC
jgi:hypothetical protein